MKLFTGSAHPELAQGIADYVGLPLGDASVTAFADGETSVRINEDIRGRDVFIIQPTCPPANHNLMELLILADAVRRASAARITAVMPFFGYARQDRKDRPRVPITAKLVANLIVAAGINRVLTVDLHAQQLQGFFDIPVDHLYALPVLARHIRSRKEFVPFLAVSPDVGGFKMTASYAQTLHVGLATVFKKRKSDTEVSSLEIIGDVRDQNVLLVDDLTTTAGTLTSAAELCKASGAKEVYASVTHAVLTDMAVERLEKSEIRELITTNTVPNPKASQFQRCGITTLSISELLGEAIKRIHGDESVSSLFKINGD
ncbi:MAG: ribose-phosphate pyrophosphokinase [Verrucomicrobia bacterium]|nr:ribose-phosphate pyrophosphokinase [Verrucomicrobiota bacterium]